MKADTAERYDQFQMLRGVACLMVFANHVVGYLSTPLNLPSTGWVAPLIVPLGFPWVWLFLVLSGFLLTKSFATGRYELTGQGIRRFYAARARRLLPLIWFAIVLWTVLYSLGLWSRGLPPLNAFREMGIAFVAPWVPYFASTNAIASVNSPIWSAVIEVHYCLVMPFLLLLGRLSKAVVAGLIAVWIVGILLLLASVVWSGGPEIFPSIYGNHFYNVGFFFAGMALALFEKPAFVRRTPWSLVVAISMTALVATQYITSWSLNLALAILPLLFLPVWSLLVARADDTIQATVPVTFRQLRVGFNPLRWLELIGAMSYSVYLMHKPLSLILIDQLGVDRLITGYASLFGVFLGGLAVLLPVIAVIYVVVEARFRRRGAGDDLNRLLRGSIASHEISQRVIGHLPVWLATFCKQKTR